MQEKKQKSLVLKWKMEDLSRDTEALSDKVRATEDQRWSDRYVQTPGQPAPPGVGQYEESHHTFKIRAAPGSGDPVPKRHRHRQ